MDLKNCVKTPLTVICHMAHDAPLNPKRLESFFLIISSHFCPVSSEPQGISLISAVCLDRQICVVR